MLLKKNVRIDNPNHHHLYPLFWNISPALVWNKGKRGKHYLPLLYIIPNNFPYYPLLQNISPTPVWNRGKEKRHYITLLYVPANLDEAIADLHK